MSIVIHVGQKKASRVRVDDVEGGYIEISTSGVKTKGYNIKTILSDKSEVFAIVGNNGLSVGIKENGIEIEEWLISHSHLAAVWVTFLDEEVKKED